jgi:AcrR family transcriptional regulator
VSSRKKEEAIVLWMRRHVPREKVDPHDRLDEARIVTAAMEMADTEGLEALSMRALARKLGVGTMSLYWYVHTKDELLDLLLDAVYGETDWPVEASGDWRADLRFLAHALRDGFRRHPWLVLIAAGRPSLGPHSMAHFEYALRTLAGTGLPVGRAAALLNVLDDYVLGVMARETAQRQAVRRSGLTDEEWQQAMVPYLRQMLETGRYPQIQRFVEADEEMADDAEFDLGLEALLTGFAPVIEGVGGRPVPGTAPG